MGIYQHLSSSSHLARSSQPYWRVFCWHGECLDGEEGSGKPMPAWNRKRNTCICKQCSWACSQAHVGTRPSKGWRHIQWSGQVNSLQYACFFLHKCSREQVLRRDCWDTESTSVEVSFSVPEATWQCPYCESLFAFKIGWLHLTWLVNSPWSSPVPALCDLPSCAQELVGGRWLAQVGNGPGTAVTIRFRWWGSVLVSWLYFTC